jgi:hypothetical protein
MGENQLRYALASDNKADAVLHLRFMIV